MIVGAVTPWLGAEGRGSRQCLLFQAHVGMEVHLGGLHGLVTEPKGNHGAVDAFLEQFHGSGVTEHMRRDLLSFQRRAVLPCRSGMLGHEPFDRVAAQGSAAVGGKHRIFRLGTLPLKPVTEHGDGVATKRRRAVLSALSFAAQMGAVADDDVLAPQPNELRDSEPGLDGDQKEGSVSTPDPCRWIRSGEQSLDLCPVEELDGLALEALAGHRQDTLADEGVGGFRQRHVTEEGMDRGQAGVAGPSTVAAVGLDVLEELADEGRIEIFDEQIGGRLAESLGREVQQQPERVAVSSDGVGACVPLAKSGGP